MLVLFIAGVQVPEMPFVEIAGKIKFVPEQIGGIWSKIGVGAIVFGVIEIGTMASFVQRLDEGVKVYI